MGKKLRELAGDVGENQLASTVKESAQQIWLAGLGAFVAALAVGATLVGEVVDYQDIYRLCYIRGPEGILIGLAQELG